MHLFAGAGRGLLADILLGHQCVCAVEINPYCQQVLSARQKDGILPWFPIFGDIKEFDGRPWKGLVDVIAGGFPCQDISVAGKGKGISGERSGLWKEMARVVREVGPIHVFVENSPALTVRGLGRILSDLAEMGYDARWGVLGVGDSGGLHERNRIWIVAHSNAWEKRNQRLISKNIPKQPALSWCKDIRRVEDLRERSDLFGPMLLGGYNGIPNGVDRVASIGNAQHPSVAALAWHILNPE